MKAVSILNCRYFEHDSRTFDLPMHYHMDEQKKIQKQISQILENTPKIPDSKLDLSKVWCMLEELKIELDTKNTKALSKRRHVGIQASPKNIYQQKYYAESKILNLEKEKNGHKINNRKKAIITPYASVEKSSWAANKVANDVLAKFFESSTQQSSSSSTQSKTFNESSDSNTLVYKDKLLQKWLKQHANAHSSTLTTPLNSGGSNYLDNIDAVKNNKVHQAEHIRHHKHHHHKRHDTHLVPVQDKSLFKLPYNPTLLSTTPSSSSNDSLLSFVYHKRWPSPIMGPKSSDSSGRTSSSLTTGTTHSTSSDGDHSTESENQTRGKTLTSNNTPNSEKIIATSNLSKSRSDRSVNFNATLSQHSLTTNNTTSTSRTYSTTSESSSDHTVRSADLLKTRQHKKSLKKELRNMTKLKGNRARGTQITDELGSISSSLTTTSSSTPTYESANTQFS